MGYWLVLGLAILAGFAVVTALGADGAGAGRSRHRKDGGRSWVALGATGTSGSADDWVAALTATLPPGTTGAALGSGDATIADVRHEQLPRALGLAPDAAVLLTGTVDLLGGVPLRDYERDLAATLDALAAADCAAVVVTLPDLSRLPGLARPGLDQRAVGALVERWEDAIIATARTAGVAVVDLAPATDDLLGEGSLLSGRSFCPSPGAHARLTRLLAPAVAGALRDQTHGVADPSDRSEDPAHRPRRFSRT